MLSQQRGGWQAYVEPTLGIVTWHHKEEIL
jgi:hypothetical protein